MTNRVDVSALIEEQSRSRFQLTLMILITAAAFLEGLDSQLQGYTAPALIKLWHINHASFSRVFVFFQLGFMVGAFALGNLGDIIGRRLTINFGVLLFGIFTLAGVFATDVTFLTVTRFLSAIFLGSAIPNSIALTIDYSPHRIRSLRIGYMFISYSIGSSAGGFLSAWLIPTYGWQSIYWVCGFLSIALGVVLFLYLPESIRFLVIRHRSQKALIATILKFSPQLKIASDTEFFIPRSVERRPWVGELFKGHRAIMTGALWAGYGLSLMALIFVTSWLPTILADTGIGYSRSVIATGLFQVGGAAGSLAAGWSLDRSKGILRVAAICLVAVPSIISIGQSVTVPAMLMLFTFVAGFCVVGTHGGLNALSGSLYPTALRSTGAGWASGVGRIGAIIGPLIGSVLISQHLSFPVVFLIVSIPSFCIVIFLLIINFSRPTTVPKKFYESQSIKI
jgi:AAHS family 4-hydroxybenzoate transporter-like MFS transporter